MLGNKDLAYREEVLAAEERRAARDQSSKERHQDRWKLTADIDTDQSQIIFQDLYKKQDQRKREIRQIASDSRSFASRSMEIDKQGQIMTRKCRFCDQWYFDFDCPKHPISYSLIAIFSESLNQIGSSSEKFSDESNPEESSSDDES